MLHVVVCHRLAKMLPFFGPSFGLRWAFVGYGCSGLRWAVCSWAVLGPCVLGPSAGPVLGHCFFFARLGASTDLADPFAAVSLGHEFLLIRKKFPWGTSFLMTSFVIS